LEARQDGQLAADVATSSSQAAFEELVRRHEGMVFNECCRLLDDVHDAEDAAQAVFLVLWKKANSLRARSTVAGWLHRVAANVCRNAQRARNIRRIREREATGMSQRTPAADASWEAIKDVIDEELTRLPEKYRLPVILFHLEGRSLEEMSALLCAKVPTIGTRLNRGREMLRSRLVRRGVSISTAALVAAIGAHAKAAVASTAFVSTVVRAAALFAGGNASTTAVSVQAATLADGALRMMALARLKIAVGALIAGCLVGAASVVTVAVALPSLIWATASDGLANSTPVEIVRDVNAFNRLSRQDKLATVMSVYAQRARATANIEATSVTHVYNVHFVDGKPGKLKEDIARYVCRLRRADEVQWACVDWYRPKMPDRATNSVVTVIDRQAGIARSFATHVDLKRVYGSIDTHEDPITINARFHHWFDVGRLEPNEFFPLWYLMNHQRSLQFDPPDNEHEVRVSADAVKEEAEVVHRTFWLDPTRGYLPMRICRKFEIGAARWIQYDTEVTETKQVDGVWFPVHILETMTSHKSQTRGWVTIIETTVDGIKLGTVKKQDLKVVSPIGASVDDRLKGKRFIVGQEGEQ